MPANLEVVAAMYEALRQGDAATLVKLLHPDCVARTSPGLPVAGGQVTQGPRETLTKIWGAVDREFDVFPDIEEYREATDGTVIGIGTYRGTARSTGRTFEAWFAHVWTITDGRVAALQQITDTAQWNRALAPG
jgi:ketosteroid isomerase-like protein